MHTDTEACARAVRSRDPRFDGWFFTAVRTTGIYCRPSCPAMTPKTANMEFYPSAAAAQAGGYRACKRCRPDASPGSPQWDARSDLVARAVRLIADGVVDREGVAGLAARLGYSVRQVERQVRAELGAGPLALARSQRAQTARVLIETTDLPLTQVAYAAGFGSIRAFNRTVREVYATAPRALRPHRARTGGDRGGTAWHQVRLRLPARLPLTLGGALGHLAATGVPGVEEWHDGAYRRTLRLPHGPGVLALADGGDHVAARLWLTDLSDLQVATSRARRMLDLDADPPAVDEVLAADPALAASVAARPGLRVPRSADPQETALRVVLGQQVSTAAARTHAARLVAAVGEPLAEPVGGLTHLFPEPARVAQVDPQVLALPSRRRATVLALAEALADGTVDLDPGSDPDLARSALLALPGVGPWTVEMTALRGWGDPDAFPLGDLGVRRGAQRLGLPDDPDALSRRSRRWQPWRACATAHLWAATDHEINHVPGEPR